MFLATFESLCRELNQTQVRYLVAGGLAVNAHGYVRATNDIDLVFWLDPLNIQKAFEACARAGYQPVQPISADDFANPALREQWRTEKGMVVLKMWNETDPSTPLDIFVYEPFDFAEEYARARLESFAPDLQIPVISLGTLLRMKTAADRPQDQEDIRKLRKLHGLD